MLKRFIQWMPLCLAISRPERSEINPGGGTKNCVNCVVATDALLAGCPACALPGGLYEIDVLERIFGAEFKDVENIKDVIESLELAGPGSRGIVYGMRKSGIGHVLNAANQHGV
ncbi:hypothetical protein GTP55_09565 [Duganella sp. FT109W]|uniref:Tox-PL domain-containing protein n=1 Tax=Duganella margarita TaxID=2692170 RepID=A0ABW9WGX5_9BURK|nr:toxin glutamine deamidase domain-containing protein [Duganella margarita]MYN39619.1 hypothetical protein [Duganella margarita]